MTETPCQSPTVSPDLWFARPHSPKSRRAKQLCQACPVKGQCATVAVSEGIPFGVWGGLDENDREWLWDRMPGGRPTTFDQSVSEAPRLLLKERRNEEARWTESTLAQEAAFAADRELYNIDFPGEEGR